MQITVDKVCLTYLSAVSSTNVAARFMNIHNKQDRVSFCLIVKDEVKLFLCPTAYIVFNPSPLQKKKAYEVLAIFPL